MLPSWVTVCTKPKINIWVIWCEKLSKEQIKWNLFLYKHSKYLTLMVPNSLPSQYILDRVIYTTSFFFSLFFFLLFSFLLYLVFYFVLFFRIDKKPLKGVNKKKKSLKNTRILFFSFFYLLVFSTTMIVYRYFFISV